MMSSMSFDAKKDGEEAEIAVGESSQMDDYLSNNNNDIGKPTEYSASIVEHPTTKRNHELEQSDLEIKSPV